MTPMISIKLIFILPFHSLLYFYMASVLAVEQKQELASKASADAMHHQEAEEEEESEQSLGCAACETLFPDPCMTCIQQVTLQLHTSCSSNIMKSRHDPVIRCPVMKCNKCHVAFHVHCRRQLIVCSYCGSV